ncbi:DNA polymerase III subunit epsilon [Gallibacterium salpingitidis]|uniref:DNA polymerase III subunit epsilon n=1 Tax=Gallibacterium salpingitidis TaxID=505341 RepID=A0AB36E1W6_9PAST|nr:DNA polymerase III subunit epsilon [Gallibacterium salpingitidis]OBX07815.1 DNA polymerase III subunit epsilon [Gallibacterium salpingitidis]OBX09718.1 DNA polymerase III subunit epsilon [Gallibacterium salpingitidis]WKT00859.1 DNA polymerase III subunit epsilon [Gallibacterium salpingitidis]
MQIDENRIVVLDTETTGMSGGSEPQIGHRIIEIGAVELVNRRHTGRNYHVYLQPDREVDAAAIEVHGITNEFLVDKPRFAEIEQDFVNFIKGAELVIHNAPFDVAFINQEFKFLKEAFTTDDICRVTDSLKVARELYPGKKNSLDALCSRLGIDNSKRTLHGALLDAEILADVYLAMTGGQVSLALDSEPIIITGGAMQQNGEHTVLQRDLVILKPNEEELAAHQKYIELINKKSGNQCLWEKLLAEETH